MVVKKLISHMQKIEPISLSLTMYKKKNSKWIKYLGIKPETLELLANNTGKYSKSS